MRSFCHQRWTFWQKVDNLAAKIRLAQMLQDGGCKRKVRVQATYNYVTTLFN